ncbi:MAG: aspartate aminotransferase family protein [Bacteroidota bacterium]|jgi:acetylornithine/succinyldiaminopimelate/putrescine aminotransferase|nr:aspartate aminotransferase family protein [Bacteroidales bacterium]MDI9534462.1 aspartate aminotransferase family protein [Bacteroidota bacterium]HNY43309.1 aspartate aminotransferase family protein [Bacteroidales bacterium]HOD89083.1 aspartate aminotransferase family protein [Bacteroidales bacterium]
MISNRELFLNYLGQTSESPYLLEIESANGIYLIGPDKKKYIDLISGVSVSSLGHNFPPIKKAIEEQVQKHLHLMVYGEFIQSPQVKLAEYLVKLLPQEINSVYLVNSGSEAIEGAVKLAKRYTGRTKMCSFVNAYHGSSHAALSLCGNEDFKKSFRPLLPEVYILRINNYEDLNIIDEDTACVVIEPIQAEAGIIIPDKKWFKVLETKCKQNGTLLIIDEVQTGFGRTGKMFGFQHFDITPDIVCFAKALGGGMPIGAFVASKKIMHSFTTNPILGHITTFGGHPVSAAAALAFLQHLNQSQLIEEVEEKEKLFRKNLKHQKIKEIRGKGLLLAVEIENFDMVLKLVKQGLKDGFITDWFIFHDSAFRIAPPLNITKEEILLASKLIIESLNKI